ncbi:MAG TPA: hypothetical protein VLN46_07285 [Gillisia sp.]|nr:hypothetical protein [Gillisia sp.]
MIKKIILIAVIILSSSPVLSQNNISLKGRIIADSLQGSSVHIINLTQKTGTVNSKTGDFEISVRENDVLLFSSIEFEKKEIIITPKILNNAFLKVDLALAVNELDDVNLSNITLTGNINTDLENIETVKGLPLISAANFMNARFKSDFTDPLRAPENLAFQQNNILQETQMDIIGAARLISDLLGIKKPRKTILPAGYNDPMSIQIRNLFSDDFFITSLNIKEEKIRDFLFYLDDQEINRQLLRNENRMALIELLIDHSEKYKSVTSEN